MAEIDYFQIAQTLLLIVVLAGPWLHALTRGRSPNWLDTLSLLLAVLGLMPFGLVYGLNSAGCWLELVLDETDKCTVITDYLWVLIVVLMLANVIVGARHQLSKATRQREAS